MTQTKSTQTHRTFIACLLACLLVLCAGVAVAGDDGNIVVHERHHIKLELDEAMDVIEIDDLEVGESRQFFTDDGKEIVVTRGEEGVDITVDGDEIDIPKTIRVETLHEEFHGDGDRKFVIRTGHSDGHDNVWVTSGGEAKAIVEIGSLGDGHAMHWVSSDGGDIRIRRSSAAEHLKESGALDALDEDQRQAILDALEEFDSTGLHRKMLFVEKVADGDGEE